MSFEIGRSTGTTRVSFGIGTNILKTNRWKSDTKDAVVDMLRDGSSPNEIERYINARDLVFNAFSPKALIKDAIGRLFEKFTGKK